MSLQESISGGQWDVMREDIRPKQFHDQTLEVAPRYRIMACVGDPLSFDHEWYSNLERMAPREVDYTLSREDQAALGQRSAGPGTYAILGPNMDAKSSYKFKNCTGFALVGVEKGSGANVSVLSHQNPKYFLMRRADEFKKDLSETLTEFVERTVEGTRDAVLFGGNYFTSHSEIRNRSLATIGTNYIDSITTVAELIRDRLHIEPHVVVGPSMASGKHHNLSVVLDTDNRRLFIVRPLQPTQSNNISFPASEVKSHEAEWNNDSKHL